MNLINLGLPYGEQREVELVFEFCPDEAAFDALVRDMEMEKKLDGKQDLAPVIVTPSLLDGFFSQSGISLWSAFDLIESF
jgi:hypothetical protein